MPEVGRRPTVLGRTLLRFGVPPLLLAPDALALTLPVVLRKGSMLATAGLAATALVLYGSVGLYRPRLMLSLLDDAPPLLGGLLVSVALVLVLGGALPEPLPGTGAVIAACVLGERGSSYVVIRLLRAQGRMAHRTLVLGAGQVGQHLAAALCEHREYGLLPVGFVDSHPPPLTSSELPVLGGHEVLVDIIRAEDIGVVIAAFGSATESEMVKVIRTCDRLSCEIFFVPRLFELSDHATVIGHIWGIPLARLRRGAFRSGPRRLKRAADVALSLTTLVLLSPLLLCCAVAVRWEGGRGVFFRQQRIGLDGRPFVLLKFRSMSQSSNVEAATLWQVDRPRLRPVGRFLRRTSLDELPQLINVLRGDMSLVGPRPERPHYVDSFSRSYPHYMSRHRMPAGLTGWAQVHGLRGDTSIEDRARFDNVYIESWSVWLDVKIMARTLLQVLLGRGS